MVFAFLRGSSGEAGLDHVVTKAISMLGDARHSFDLATLAVLTDIDPADVANDIFETDERINLAEQELRSELIVHVAVRGSADIGTVLGFTLLLKKIERVGDQAKNILDLAVNGVSLAENPDIDAMLEERRIVSTLFAESAELLADPDHGPRSGPGSVADFIARVDALSAEHQRKIAQFMTSDRPGREVVPLAIYYRYLHRIVANLSGVVRTSVEPVEERNSTRRDLDD